MTILLGLDLGKAADHTALVLAEPTDVIPPVYDITQIERIELKTRYTEIVAHVCEIVRILRNPDEYERPDVVLVLDHTGCGIPVAEMFLDAEPDCEIVLVTITAGNRVTYDEVGIHIPKGDLVSVVQRVLQENRLRVASDDPHADLLLQELTDMRAKISQTGHVSYEASVDWRSGKHDDIVLAGALALWYGEQMGTTGRLMA